MSTARPSLHVTTERTWRGGEQQVKLLSDGLLARGEGVAVAAPAGSPLLRDRAAAGCGFAWDARGGWDVLAAFRLARHAARIGARLYHAHTGHGHSLAQIAARIHQLPVVVTRRVDFPPGRGWWSRRKYLRPGTHYIAISQAVRRSLTDAGVAPDRIALVPSGVDPERFPFRGSAPDAAARARLGIPPEQFLVLNVAALTGHKDHASLLAAFAELRKSTPAAQLAIAGDGEYRAPLRQLAARLGLGEAVRFLGFVSDLAPWYAAADVFVLSSYLEGLGTALLDAMNAGVPIVATEAGGIPDAIEHGRTGWLAPPRNPSALAEALAEALGHPQAAARRAAAAREKFLTTFTADAMVEGTLAVYRQCAPA